MFRNFDFVRRQFEQAGQAAAQQARSTQQCSSLQTSYTQAQRNLATSGCAAPAQSGASAGNSECAAKLQTVNQRRSDFNTSQSDYDTTCDPVGAYDRRLQTARSAFTNYKDSTQKAVDSLESVFTARLVATDKLGVAYGELQKTLKGLTDQYTAMDKKNRDLDQAARTQRRLFLDDDPQGGVGGAPGVRTRDDRILLAFWVNYAAALLAAALFFCWWRGVDRMTTALTTVVIVGVGYLAAYPFIAYYA
jgi:chromosome segregation ATPase